MGEKHAAPHTPHIDEAWTPARGVRAAERALGRAELVDWCVGLLTGDIDGADPDTPSLRWIGGGAAGDERNRTYWEHENHAYWPRVWAARALRYVWEPWAARAVIRGLDDPTWRVREHCCALVRVRELADAADRVAELADAGVEDTPRVRAAAVKALAAVGEFEHAGALRTAADDPHHAVRAAASAALEAMARRLDRPLD